MSQNAFQMGAKQFDAVPEIWSKILLKTARVSGVYSRIAKDHSSEIASNADSIHLRIVDIDSITVGNYYTRSAVEATAGTEGTINYATPKVNKVTLELTESPYTAATFEDWVMKTADVDFQADYIDGARYQLSRQIDTFVMNTIIAAAGKTIDPFNATTAGEGEMFDTLLQMAAYLKEQGAMPIATTSDLWGSKGLKEYPYVVINPAVERFVIKEPAFVKIDDTNKNAFWKEGRVIGTIAGLVVLVSSNMPTTANKVTIFAGVKSATHYAIKKITERTQPAEEKFHTLWSTLFACGAVVSHPKLLVKAEITVA